MNLDLYMERCVQLAQLGLGKTYPNPMVGSVIVYKDKIIGEGYHQQYGAPHAEVNAIDSVKDKSLLAESTIYVSLEPCSHFGKTPPCSDLIIKNRLKKVVIGVQDPFHKVNGSGIDRLKSAGIQVEFSNLNILCTELNKRFFTFHQQNRPYIILKYAQSKDGFMDVERNEEQNGVHWITQKETKALTHLWRSQEQAILIGAKTLINDAPSLTVRHATGDNPVRIILDSKGDISLPKNWDERKDFVICAKDKSIGDILEELHKKEIQSVIIEGGKATLDLFISENIWDEARVLTGIKNIGKGILAPKIKGNVEKEYYYGQDLIKIIKNASHHI